MKRGQHSAGLFQAQEVNKPLVNVEGSPETGDRAPGLPGAPEQRCTASLQPPPSCTSPHGPSLHRWELRAREKTRMTGGGNPGLATCRQPVLPLPPLLSLDGRLFSLKVV